MFVSSYQIMVDDESRMQQMEEAVRRRLSVLPEATVVLDIGTGPFAVLALMAARHGAKTVYAIEAFPEAARRARAAVLKAEASGRVPPCVVQVIEGLSTELTLPTKVDLLVFDLVGSVASDEGVHTVVRDAQQRHLRRPFESDSYIPWLIQTVGAPASYLVHSTTDASAGTNWSKFAHGEPLRLGSCVPTPPWHCDCAALTDERVGMLAEPQIVEHIDFSDRGFPPAGKWRPAPTRSGNLSYAISAERIATNEGVYRTALSTGAGMEPDKAAGVAARAARSLSGFALWPRLVLDPMGDLVVETRSMRGELQCSHWDTVLPLLTDQPKAVRPGQVVELDVEVILGTGTLPPRYAVHGRLVDAEVGGDDGTASSSAAAAAQEEWRRVDE